LALIDAPGRRFDAILVEDEPGHLPLSIGHERNLGRDDFGKIFGFALREDLDLRLPGGLCYEPVAVAGDAQDETRTESIVADVAVEDARVEADCRARPRLVREAPRIKIRSALRFGFVCSRRADIHAGLMQNHAGDAPLRIPLK